jgi:hypothetical protein
MGNSANPPWKQNAKLTAGGLVPWAGKLADIGKAGADATGISPGGDLEDGERMLPENQWLRILDQTNQLFKFPGVPVIHPVRAAEAPKEQYTTNTEAEDTINSIVSHARNVPMEKRTAFVQREIARYMTGDLINFQGQRGPANAIAMKVIMQRLGKGASGTLKTSALQQANAAKEQ